MPSLKNLSKEAKDEAITSLAALLLVDAGAEVSGDKIAEVIAASGNSVEKYWPAMFASLCAKTNINDLLNASTTPGSGGGGGGAPAPAAGAATKGAPAAAPVAEKPKDEPVEVDMSGGAGLFGEAKSGKY
jgi:large subunit ribosomal protein LP1